MLLIVVISQIHSWKICLSFWWLTCFGSVVNTLINKSLNIRWFFSELKQTLTWRSLKSWNLIKIDAFLASLSGLFHIWFSFCCHLSLFLTISCWMKYSESVRENVLQTSVYNLTSDWFILEHLVSHTREYNVFVSWILHLGCFWVCWYKFCIIREKGLFPLPIIIKGCLLLPTNALVLASKDTVLMKELQ